MRDDGGGSTRFTQETGHKTQLTTRFTVAVACQVWIGSGNDAAGWSQVPPRIRGGDSALLTLEKG